MTAALDRARQASRAVAPPHERDLGRLAALALLRRNARPASVGTELPRLAVVGQQRLEDCLQLVADRSVLDRDHDLDPMDEVPRHQVGASQQVRLLLVRFEAVEPAVLEEAAEYGADADVLALLGYA